MKFSGLGVNGAGNTTLIRSLLGLIKLTSGSIKFKGSPLTADEIQKNFGFLPENFLPPKNLKAFEFLKILGRGFGCQPQEAVSLLEMAGLKPHRKKYIREFSRGMIQRLGLATCLLKKPQVLVLDEPTLGLDPVGQRSILEILAGLKQKGKTIFFSSHILAQVENLCSRIGILHEGQLIFVGTVQEIIRKHNVASLEQAFLEEVRSR